MRTLKFILPLLAAATVAVAAESQDKLLAVLRSDAPQFEKAEACRQLGVVGGKEAVPVLAALLTDEKLSHMARYALEPNPDPSVNDALRAALPKVKGRLLVGVIGSLGVRRDAKAVGPLTKFLADSDPQVASAAALALSKIGNTDAAKSLSAAVKTAPDAVKPAVADGCLRCAEALSAAGKKKDALALYEGLRSSPVPHVRAGAVRGLIITQGAAGAGLLVQQLRGNDNATFSVALRILANELPGKDVTKAVAAELPKLSADKQALILAALATRGCACVLPAVLTAAKSSEKDVRVAALKALGALGNASAVPVLTGAALDSDADVAQTAQATLAALPGRDVDDAVVALLDSKDAKTRELGLDMTGRRHAASAVPVLLKAAEGPDAAARLGAIKALGEVATANDMPALIKLLTGAKSPAEAGAAEKSLSAVCARASNRDACADALVAPIAGATPETKQALLRLLCSVGGAKALQSLRTAASDANTETRDAAIRALCEWPDLDAAGDLLNLAKTGATPTYKLLGIRGYLRLAANADVQPPQKLDMCKQAAELIQRDDEKRLLLGVLGTVPTGPSLQMVAAYLDNPGTKEEAATAAVAIVERMSRGRNAGPLPPVAGDVMQKVAQVSGNAELVKKATAFAKRAQRKAPAKK